MKLFLAVVALAVAVNARAYESEGEYDGPSPIPSLKDVTFTLYNKKSGDNGIQMFLNDKESIKKAGFNPALPVKVSTHGYATDACADVVQCLRKAFIGNGDVNFISVDWSAYAKSARYEDAAMAVKTVGLHLSKFMRFLRDETKFDVKNVHAMGHGLGAHVVSFMSDEFPKEKIGRISAFDPSGPIFDSFQTGERLDSGDALVVDVIHTSTIYPGTRNLLGSIDFYPNTGNGQPGCGKFDFQCQSNMAYRYFTYTVKTNKNYEATKCNSLKDAENGTCDGPKGPMGIGAGTTKPGIYYVKITTAPDSC